MNENMAIHPTGIYFLKVKKMSMEFTYSNLNVGATRTSYEM